MNLIYIALIGAGVWWFWPMISDHLPQPSSTVSRTSGADTRSAPHPHGQQQPRQPARQSGDAADFYRQLLGNIDREWSIMLGSKYRPPVLVLYGDATNANNIGIISARKGPLYNPGDGKIYVPVSFDMQIQRMSGCSGNQCQAATAFVLAHEIGHRVQQLLGMFNGLSEVVELQADCLSGAVLGHKNKRLNGAFIEPGDMDVIIRLVHAMGDDVITNGHPPPPERGHGSAAQRVHKFNAGWQGGTLASCTGRAGGA